MKKIFLIIALLTVSIYSQTYEIPLSNANITKSLQKGLDIADSVLIQAQKDSIGAMIADSTNSGNIVNKTSLQTITGQKNFMGTVKFGDDSSWSFEKNTVNQLVKTVPNSSTKYRWLRFPINDGGWHDEFALQTYATSNAVGVAPNYVMRLGYNPNQTNNARATWGLTWESYWQPSDTTDRWSEWYLEYYQPITHINRRPFFASASWITNRVELGLGGDRVTIGDPDDGGKRIIEYGDNGSVFGFSSAKRQLMFGNTSLGNLQYRFYFPSDSSAWFFNDVEYFRIRKNVMGNDALMINAGQRRGIMIGANYNDKYSAMNLYVSNVSGRAQGVIYSSQDLTVQGQGLNVADTTGQKSLIVYTTTGQVTLGNTIGTGTGKLYAGEYYTGSTRGYLTSALGSLTASGLYVAESSGGSPTRQLYYRTITINGVTIQVLTTDVP